MGQHITFSESSGLNNSIYGKSEAPIKSIIEDRAEFWERQSVIPLLFCEEKSENYAEKYTGLTSMDDFEAVGEGGAVPENGFQEGYSKVIENVTFKSKFDITAEIIEDRKNVELKKRPKKFTDAYYRTREHLAARMYGEAIKGSTSFKLGTATFDTTGSDGVALFHTAHPLKVKKTTVGNKFSDPLSASSISAMECAMQQFKDDNGQDLDICPDTIVVPSDYRLLTALWAAVGSDKDPSTSNNAFNYQFGKWNVIPVKDLNNFIPASYFTASYQPWIMLDSRYLEDYECAVFQNRTDLEIRNYVDEDTHNAVWTGRARFGAGFTDWRFAAVGGVSSGTALIS